MRSVDSPFGLGQTRVDADRGEVAFLQKCVELRSTRNGFDEDADLRMSSSPTMRSCKLTWLNSRLSSKSFNFLFFSFSSSFR